MVSVALDYLSDSGILTKTDNAKMVGGRLENTHALMNPRFIACHQLDILRSRYTGYCTFYCQLKFKSTGPDLNCM